MSDMSATCPGVVIRGDSVRIAECYSDPRADCVSIEAYDLDAFVDAVIAARDKLREAGHLTAWSRDADGMGNCGPIPSPRA